MIRTVGMALVVISGNVVVNLAWGPLPSLLALLHVIVGVLVGYAWRGEENSAIATQRQRWRWRVVTPAAPAELAPVVHVITTREAA